VKAFLQKSDGSERTLEVTKPDPEDGTYVVSLAPDVWVRIVPERRPSGDGPAGVMPAIDALIGELSYNLQGSGIQYVIASTIHIALSALADFLIDGGRQSPEEMRSFLLITLEEYLRVNPLPEIRKH
jgi:hypothetical protein